ncbi:CopD family protein [Rhizobium sp. SAFR-030]|uniref:CopD family protein n=1 Tax=Rhizobium sp. SAFR-030 TaxID=3387277 RepID=UPI003F7E842A
MPFILLVQLSKAPALRSEAIMAMRRFSRLGHGAVALVLLSGAANTWFILGRAPLDWHSSYQFEMALKIAAALTMTFLALANRYLVLPLNRTHGLIVRKLLITDAGAELALGFVALALVATFGLGDPTS